MNLMRAYSKMLHLASVEYKYDIKVFQEIALNHIGNSLQEISHGHRLIKNFDVH